MVSKAFVVLNPVAGNSDAGALRQSLERRFADVDWSYEVYRTTGEERVTEIVRAALDRDFDVFVAVGGDGTVSGVAAGLVHTDIPLGIIPVGTGNALARDLGVPLNSEEALRLLTGEHSVVDIDAMQAGDRIYLLNVTVGISAVVMRDTERQDKRRLGMLAYVWTGFRKLLGWQPHRFNVVADGQMHRFRASEVAVVNAGAIGDPSLRWGTQVRLDDGQLEACILRAQSAVGYLRLAWSMLLHRQRRDPGLRCLVVERHIAIHTGRPLPVQADGEFVGHTPVDISVVPGAVRMIVPQSWPLR